MRSRRILAGVGLGVGGFWVFGVGVGVRRPENSGIGVGVGQKSSDSATLVISYKCGFSLEYRFPIVIKIIQKLPQYISMQKRMKPMKLLFYNSLMNAV